MKKQIVTLAALLIISIASAQTDTKTAQPTQPEPQKVMEDKDKAVQDADMQNNVNQDPEDKVVPRKDELKTRDHVKSTLEADKAKDSVMKPKKVKRTKKRS